MLSLSAFQPFSLPESSYTFHDFIPDISSSTHLDFGTYSRFHYSGLLKLNYLPPHANNFPVAMVMHHNRWNKEKRKTPQKSASSQKKYTRESNVVQRKTQYVHGYCNRLPLVWWHSTTSQVNTVVHTSLCLSPHHQTTRRVFLHVCLLGLNPKALWNTHPSHLRPCVLLCSLL